jgi:hypothetical protein
MRSLICALVALLMFGAAHAASFTTCGVPSGYNYSYRCYVSYNSSDASALDYIDASCDDVGYAHGSFTFWYPNPWWGRSPKLQSRVRGELRVGELEGQIPIDTSMQVGVSSSHRPPSGRPLSPEAARP